MATMVALRRALLGLQWVVNGELCIGALALKGIKKGEEITFDYNYERYGSARAPCHATAFPRSAGASWGNEEGCREVGPGLELKQPDLLRADDEEDEEGRGGKREERRRGGRGGGGGRGGKGRRGRKGRKGRKGRDVEMSDGEF